MDHLRQLVNCIYQIGESVYVIFEPGTQRMNEHKVIKDQARFYYLISFNKYSLISIMTLSRLKKNIIKI